MLYGEVLLLFSESAPCWTKDLVSMAGEDGEGLEALRREGFLDCVGEVYVLTGEGAHAFREEARECFFDGAPGTPPADLRKSLFATMRLLLDGRHLQRWCLEEYFPGESRAATSVVTERRRMPRWFRGVPGAAQPGMFFALFRTKHGRSFLLSAGGPGGNE